MPSNDFGSSDLTVAGNSGNMGYIVKKKKKINKILLSKTIVNFIAIYQQQG